MKCSMFQLRRMCILLFLDEMFYKYLLSLSGLMCHIRSVFPCGFCTWMICPLMNVGCLSPPLLLCYSQSLSLWLLVFALYIEVLLYWVHIYLQLLPDWFLDHHVVSFLISSNSLYLTSILSDRSIVTPAVFWFPLAWNYLSIPSLSICMCPLLGGIYMSRIFVSIQLVCVFCWCI